MRLSEAIRLGAMVGPQIYMGMLDGDGGSCAIGASLIAIGKQQEAIDGMYRGLRFRDLVPSSWGWIVTNGSSRCPACQVPANVYVLIAHLNDGHRWTREQIADWVATIEPPEVPTPEPHINSLVEVEA